MKLITFIELSSFSRNIKRYMDDESLQGLELYLIAHPEAGDVWPGTRGCRKLRWQAEGRGKRGGLRIVYFYRSTRGRIYLMTVYAKNEETNLPVNFILKLREEIDDE